VLRKLTAAGIGAAALVAIAAGPAAAGEVTGNGKPAQGASHANSICAFSG
jgi:hypothetical protein